VCHFTYKKNKCAILLDLLIIQFVHMCYNNLAYNGLLRAVRAMNETLKQNRLLREQGDDRSFSLSSNDRNSDLQKDVCSLFHLTENQIYIIHCFSSLASQ
jgi:hypothetical protein